MSPHLYLAGINTASRLREAPFGTSLLESFVDREHRTATWNAQTRGRFVWSLDSGAFTAHRQGTPIELEAYIDFLQAREGQYEWCLSLDVIDGGEKANARNYEAMRAAGLYPSPVFHEGEDLCLLDDYLAELEQYEMVVGTGRRTLALGAQWPRSDERVRQWLRLVFERIHRNYGCRLPRTKVGIPVDHIGQFSRDPDKLTPTRLGRGWAPRIHGLAMVAFGGEFPFTSVDSRGWASALARLSKRSPWTNLSWGALIGMYNTAVHAGWAREQQINEPEQLELEVVNG